METYHQRRPERAITDPAEMLAIIAGQKTMTLAMCKDNEPYLFTVNYGYERDGCCFYFHCAHAGKKLAYLAANPIVWGQIYADDGYMDGSCDHAYHSVQFRGRVTFLESESEKLHAMDVMIDHLESNPVVMKERVRKPGTLGRARLARIDVEIMTAKRHPAPKT